VREKAGREWFIFKKEPKNSIHLDRAGGASAILQHGLKESKFFATFL
jgi:hypothetical protein